MATLGEISKLMQALGANRILLKPLSNNDNSKQQIYFGGSFEVLQDFPLGEIRGDRQSSKGPIFKAPLKLCWITEKGETEEAIGSQIILYPKYPEIRLSGFLKGCSIAPSKIMQPLTPEQRAHYTNQKRGMVLGLTKDTVFVYAGSWDEKISQEIQEYAEKYLNKQVLSVFYEYYSSLTDSQEQLITKLKNIYNKGFIRSKKLEKNGSIIDYEASNGAGFTLEAEFGIVPNGNARPDFLDWELKAISKSSITLMTPEPDVGLYCGNYIQFMKNHASSKKLNRLDFTGRHKLGKKNLKTNLTLFIDGYDLVTHKITDSTGGYFLKNDRNEIVAGWTFGKLLNHWKNKHTKTCYVVYHSLKKEEKTYYKFGPKVLLGKGASVDKFLNALATEIVIYDPGCKYEQNNRTGKWVPKKRNQFRVSRTKSAVLYDEYENFDLSEL
ncbi:MvaI/BcnI family restriction endonuclease [Acinetobacter schindleri]|uniref:MvaI/BcnI family restriction endonuclease n=1 Tax=Acinetobacter schindleri TaxID=108981 RepID=UPI00289A1ACA|nr:MvaI/BcnI family restriction endonuclease [Acinetobacter schindleri]